MKKIRSLFDRRDDSDEGDGTSEDRRTTNSFAGGSKSGLAIQNPEEKVPGETGPERTWGNAKISGGPAPPGTRKITIYKNGFQTEGEEFRSFDRPENLKFLNDVRSGYAPEELTKGATSPISLVIEDKSSDVFEPPPPPKYTLFSGAGQSLGSSSSRPTTPSNREVIPASTAEILKLDLKKPTTTLRIRFHNGVTTTQQFNTTSTIEDLHNFVAACTPGSGPYRLLSGFPPKPISEDVSATISSAGLLNETVTQILTPD